MRQAKAPAFRTVSATAQTPWSGEDNPLRTLRRKLARGMIAHVKAGTTDLAPGVLHDDVTFYTDPELFARERQKLFRETPLVACLSSELAEPGSFRLFDDAGPPIVVIRGKDAQVRAFLNVCPHRGSRVVRSDGGKAGRFTCRFHGWTFDTLGQAIGIPEEGQFCGEIDGQKRLLPCPAAERHGLVFVQPTPGSVMDLDAHLGDFGEELEPLELDRCEPVARDEIESPSNWKFTLDTYFENYHLPSLHKDTFARIFAANLCVFETWGPHHRFTFPPRTIHDWLNMPEADWPVHMLPLSYFLFPNLVISVGSVTPSGSTIGLTRLFPKSVREMTAKLTFCAAGGVKSPEHRAEIEDSFAKQVYGLRNEDYSVTGESYAAFSELPPGAKFPVGRTELGVQNFHRNVRRLVG
jgi:nitrite reductase/ring-hydroxylating ferredoxin subunit